MTRRWWIVAAVVVALGVAVVWRFRDEATDRRLTMSQQPLEGLRGVGVFVDRLTPDQERLFAATTADLQARVEARLRNAGVAVVVGGGDDMTMSDPEVGRLVVKMRSVEKPPVLSVSFSLGLAQIVRTEARPRRKIAATTWHHGAVTVARHEKSEETLGHALEGQVDAFIRDYLAANARKR